MVKTDKTAEINNLLRLNIQYFAEDPEDKPSDDQEIVDTEADEDETGAENEKNGEVKFTQADLDRIVQERLDRDRRKREAEAEKKRQEEQGEFKELYDNVRKEFAEYKRDTLIDTLMLESGYEKDQVERYKKFIEGEEESDIKESLNALIEDIPPKKKETTEPGAYPGRTKEPEQKDGTEIGKELFQRTRRKTR